MKHAIRVFIISLISQIFLSQAITLNAYSGGTGNQTGTFLQQIDTLNRNPYLKIRKFELDIIAPSAGVQFFNDDILFLSLSKRNTRMISEHISFGDRTLYYASINDSVADNPLPFQKEKQFAIPAEGITFVDDMSGFYYSKLSERDNKVKIFFAESGTNNQGPSWEINDIPLGFCNDYNNYTHPTISNDGELMIFSSDMPGGSGEMDLYLSRFENNVWTKPENMGEKINSKGSELYAYLDNENNLYFSSNGLPGLGGYDIFFCNFNGSGWNQPLNLYDQINTKNDEVAFKLYPEDENFAFYTMIERSGITKKQLNRKLYKLELQDEYRDDELFLLSDILKDYAEGSPVLALLEVADFEQQDVEAKKTDEAGKRIADSLRAVEAEAIRIAQEKRLADSLLAIQIEEERIAEERRVADSIKMEEVKREEAEAAKNIVIYRVQILSSTTKGKDYNVQLKGTRYDTWEYYYQEVWRVTVGEFTNLTDAIKLRSACRESGYSQAFVVAFKNGVRSNDPDLFRR